MMEESSMEAVTTINVEDLIGEAMKASQVTFYFLRTCQIIIIILG